jgi:hypothetical protein
MMKKVISETVISHQLATRAGVLMADSTTDSLITDY